LPPGRSRIGSLIVFDVNTMIYYKGRRKMQTIVTKEKPKLDSVYEEYFSFKCPSCRKEGYVTKSMKDSILTCSFCGKQIIEFKLKAFVKNKAKIKKVIAEMINLKLLSKGEILS
jgi:transcription elongation factor Elf1